MLSSTLHRPPPYAPSFGPDPRDAGTSDSWIARDARLIRLTGAQPFNAEAPLPSLLEPGVITSSSLHYVRNHGAVPKLQWESHRIMISSGPAGKAVEMKMDDLLLLPSTEVVVTMSCSGNRRKEQNLIKRGVGFDWGAGAVSTARWRGVLLSALLRHAFHEHDILPDPTRRFVCFEGADTLAKGHYGTSISLERVFDPASKVLVAYEMNGHALPPDHGFPVRLIVPGFVGGRSVKWLAKISISATESDNYYHAYDNRLFPPAVVDVHEADKGQWWWNPNTLIQETNINSAIAAPFHNSTFSFDELNRQPLLVKGYAYSGTALPITRVEITLDHGRHWKDTSLLNPNEAPQYTDGLRVSQRRGHFIWVLWELQLKIEELLSSRSREIAVRCWDGASNTQPAKLTWNLTGMMNNCWYRVKFTIDEKKRSIHFQHPSTVIPSEPAGWMSDQHAPVQPTAIDKAVTPMPMPIFSRREVAEHHSQKDCWIIIDHKVYNVTPFLDLHPGGSAIIMLHAGKDVSREFAAIHGEDARRMLVKYLIGEVQPESKL